MKEIRDAQKCLKAVFYVPDLQSCCNTHMIEYLLAVTLDDIGPIIYAQILPYYWAVPTDPNKTEILHHHFPHIIESINTRLSLEHFYFFKVMHM